MNQSPVVLGSITLKGNPHPTHFQVDDGNYRKGRQVTLGPEKYAAAIYLPNGYKLVGTDGACSARMTTGGFANCGFDVKEVDSRRQRQQLPLHNSLPTCLQRRWKISSRS
jgi:hypothetical protein